MNMQEDVPLGELLLIIFRILQIFIYFLGKYMEKPYSNSKQIINAGEVKRELLLDVTVAD